MYTEYALNIDLQLHHHYEILQSQKRNHLKNTDLCTVLSAFVSTLLTTCI